MKQTLSIISFFILIFFSACNKKPEPCFMLDKNLNSLFVNDNIMFSASCSIDAKEFSWNFGDDSDTTGEVVFHTYITPGTYDVVLTATSTGRSENITRTIEIKP